VPGSVYRYVLFLCLIYVLNTYALGRRSGNARDMADKTENTESSSPRTQRLNLNLSEHVRADLDQLSKKTGSSLTEIVRFGLRLARLCFELQEGEKLGVFNKDGVLVKEVITPWGPRL